MKWEQVDLKKQTLRIPETKNDTPRTIPLSREALRILSDLPRRLEGSVWSFATNWLSLLFANSCTKAGIEDLHFHDLRHETTSRFFEKGLNPMQVAAITRHKTLQMLKRYTCDVKSRIDDCSLLLEVLDSKGNHSLPRV